MLGVGLAVSGFLFFPPHAPTGRTNSQAPNQTPETRQILGHGACLIRPFWFGLVWMSSSAFEWWRRHPPPSHIPDLITSVPGLSYCADFLSPGMQADVLHTLSRDGLLFRRGGRGCRGEPDQANVFPPIPPVAEALLRRIRSLSALAFPGQPALRHRRPLFDAMAVNRYSGGGYTKAHVDLLQYDDGIAIVSLVAPATLAFRMDGKCVRVRLGVGSLLMMCGSARYEWTHEVERVHKDERVSVVLRKLVQ